MPEWIDIFVRALIFIGILFIMTKLLGKKQISEISFFEYVSGITIGSIAGEVIMGLERSIINGAIAIITFGLITLGVDFLSLKSKKFRDVIEGKGRIFIKDGKIMEDNLKKERYTMDELGGMLRQKNVFSAADVEFALLEPSGDLSVLLKRENRPITAKDLNLKVASEKEPQTIIMDGKISDEALGAASKNREWLQIELDKLGVTLDNVFNAQVDSYGDLTVDLYDDKIKVPSPEQRPLLMAMIKKCQADLELFALETESKVAKQMYKKNAAKLNEAINILTPYLT